VTDSVKNAELNEKRCKICKPVPKTQQQGKSFCAPLKQWLGTRAGKEVLF